MKLRDKEGILLSYTQEEQGEVDAAFAEMKWHLGNLLAEMEAVKDNRLRTELSATAAMVVIRTYMRSLTARWLHLAKYGSDAPGATYRRPDFRAAVEQEIRETFCIPHFADILPRHTVRGVATGNGSFEPDLSFAKPAA